MTKDDYKYVQGMMRDEVGVDFERRVTKLKYLHLFGGITK